MSGPTRLEVLSLYIAQPLGDQPVGWSATVNTLTGDKPFPLAAVWGRETASQAVGDAMAMYLEQTVYERRPDPKAVAADGGPKSLGVTVQRIFDVLQPFSPQWRESVLQAVAVLLSGVNDDGYSGVLVDEVPVPMQGDSRVAESARVAGAVALAFDNPGVI